MHRFFTILLHGEHPRIGKSSLFYFGRYLEMEVPELLPIYEEWRTFGWTKVTKCCEYNYVTAELGYCGMYSQMGCCSGLFYTQISLIMKPALITSKF